MSPLWHLDAAAAATPHNSHLSLTSLPWHPPPPPSASSAEADTGAAASAPGDQQPLPPSPVPQRISEAFAPWFWKGAAYGPCAVFPALVSREGWWPGLLPDGCTSFSSPSPSPSTSPSSGGGGASSSSGSSSGSSGSGSGVGSPPPRSASFSAASASAFAAGFGGGPSTGAQPPPPPPPLSPRQYGSWAGAVSGALLHSFLVFEAAFLTYLFLGAAAADTAATAAAYLDVFLLAAMAAHGTGYPLLVALLVCLRGQARHLDPGPPHGVWCSPGGEGTAGLPGGVVDAAEAAAAQRDVARLTRRYAAAAAAAAAAPLAVLCCGVCGRTPVLPAAALGAWPLLSLAAFAAVRAACFAHVDAALRRLNRSSEALLRGNVGWVARRGAVPCTLFGTLWLVRRCPGVEGMVAGEAGGSSEAGLVWWQARFGCCDPLFRRLAKVVLYAAVLAAGGSNRRRVHTTRGGEVVVELVEDAPRVQRLPHELALCILGYLASPDVLTEEHLIRARVIDGSAMIG